MGSEFIKIPGEMSHHGHKNLLQAQLDLLNITKRLQTYKKLRKKEIMLKLKLKAKVDEAIEAINLLEKRLPETHLKIPKQAGRKPSTQKSKDNQTLNQEILDIKRKLSRLQY